MLTVKPGEICFGLHDPQRHIADGSPFARYMRFVFLLILLSVAFLLFESGCARPSGVRTPEPEKSTPGIAEPDDRLVWIELPPLQRPDDLFALHLALDVWAVGKHFVMARVADDVILALRDAGYPTTVLYANMALYSSSVVTDPNPVRIARVDCTVDSSCTSLQTPGLVTGIVERQPTYLVVRVTGTQLASLSDQGYAVHLLYATEEEYIISTQKGPRQ